MSKTDPTPLVKEELESILALPANFQFSQSRLQDYVDCPRRFQLRHLLMQPWPALITGSPSEFELHLEHGARLHQLAHQHALGIDPQRLAETIHEPVLTLWWRTFLEHPPADLPDTIRRAEMVATLPYAGYRLTAKFDLLAADPGQRLVIVDWKTTRRQPSRPVLAQRLQTVVYRFVAVEAGSEFFGGSQPAPSQVEMIYWFATHSGATERFGYDLAQHLAAGEGIARLVEEIATRNETIWPLAVDHSHCRFCNYRSLCERQVEPGFPEEMDSYPEDNLPEFDLEQIAEVEF